MERKNIMDTNVGRNLNKIEDELVDEDEVIRDNELVHSREYTVNKAGKINIYGRQIHSRICTKFGERGAFASIVFAGADFLHQNKINTNNFARKKNISFKTHFALSEYTK